MNNQERLVKIEECGKVQSSSDAQLCFDCLRTSKELNTIGRPNLIFFQEESFHNCLVLFLCGKSCRLIELKNSAIC